MNTPLLWHFRLSHYNEKVRWALDWKGVPHVRKAVVPGFHIFRALRLSGNTETPILQMNGQTIADSTKIIEALEATYPNPPLYPVDPAARQRAVELEDLFDRDIGPHTRRVLFFYTTPDSAYSTALYTLGESAATKLLYRAMYPGIRVVMRKSMGIDAERSAHSRTKVREMFDRVAAEVQPSGYLVGDTFTVADLTAAALLAPVVRPKEFAYPVPEPAPEAAERWIDELRPHPAFRWAERMFAQHRGRSASIDG